MSTLPRSDLKSTAPASVSRNAMNPASVDGLTATLRRARDRAEIVSCDRRPLLAGAHRDLREPLTAMLRLNSDWNVRGTDRVAVRMIEQQRQALDVMADLIDSFLTIAKPEIAQPTEPRAEEWSAEWFMTSAVDRPTVPVADGPASRVRCVLLINEDRGVLGALRIYLLCAGYRVFAAANAEEALDRAWMARVATSLIDIIIVNLDLTGDDDGLAVIDKTRLLLGYNVPAVLLATQTSMEIAKAALVTDVSLLRDPVNLGELNALIGEVLKRSRRSPRSPESTGTSLGHDEPNPELVY
jgi:DNA-binding NarL/FixJ family response regulator